MNRRTVLRSGGVIALAGLAGCVENALSHWQGDFVSPVPIEIYSEADLPYNVALEAHEQGGERQTYDQGYSVTPGERVGAPHLDGVDQRFRVIRYGNEDADGEPANDLVEQGAITRETQLVLIEITDDELQLEIIESEAEAETEQAELEGAENETTDADDQ